MTLQEFKAWFDGFTENMGEAPPTKLQWARIQARVKEIDGTAVTYPVFVERYWPRHPIYPQWTTFNADGIVFNAMQAMCALGQADHAGTQ